MLYMLKDYKYYELKEGNRAKLWFLFPQNKQQTHKKTTTIIILIIIFI